MPEQYYDVKMLPTQQQRLYQKPQQQHRFSGLDSVLQNKNDEELTEIANELELKQYEKQQQLLRNQQHEEEMQRLADLYDNQEDGYGSNKEAEVDFNNPYSLIGVKSLASNANSQHLRDERSNQSENFFVMIYRQTILFYSSYF